MILQRFALIALLTLSIAALTACGNKEDAAPAKPAYAATGNEGSISGTINFSGTAPAPTQTAMNADPVCQAQGQYTSDEILVNNGKLQNVFIHVTKGLPTDVAFAAQQAEVTLDQKGCRYLPHVLGMHVSTTLKVANQDDTTHNVHPKPKTNKEWDTNILAGSDPLKRKFTKAEIMIPVKCGVHTWMSAFIGVLEHPFFAVSDANGQFTITGLPPGEYEIEAWHERYQAQTLKVKVEPKGATKADFTVNPATAYQPSTLPLQPAIVLPTR